MSKNKMKIMNEEFGSPQSERTSVRSTKEVNRLLEETRKYILEKQNVKTSHAKIIEVLVKKYLDEEGVDYKNKENE